jgi:hypothetical protein
MNWLWVVVISDSSFHCDAWLYSSCLAQSVADQILTAGELKEDFLRLSQ